MIFVQNVIMKLSGSVLQIKLEYEMPQNGLILLDMHVATCIVGTKKQTMIYTQAGKDWTCWLDSQNVPPLEVCLAYVLCHFDSAALKVVANITKNPRVSKTLYLFDVFSYYPTWSRF